MKTIYFLISFPTIRFNFRMFEREKAKHSVIWTVFLFFFFLQRKKKIAVHDKVDESAFLIENSVPWTVPSPMYLV